MPQSLWSISSYCCGQNVTKKKTWRRVIGDSAFCFLLSSFNARQLQRFLDSSVGKYTYWAHQNAVIDEFGNWCGWARNAHRSSCAPRFRTTHMLYYIHLFIHHNKTFHEVKRITWRRITYGGWKSGNQHRHQTTAQHRSLYMDHNIRCDEWKRKKKRKPAKLCVHFERWKIGL